LTVTRATLGAARTPPSGLKVQYVQPVFRSRDWNVPFVLPTKTRPAAMAGCPDAEVEFAKPYAHFSVSVGTSAAESPALLAFWKCVFARSFPHPFHIGIEPRSGIAAAAAAQSPGSWPPAAPLADKNDATACFSAADRSLPWTAMTPLASSAARIC
jgi:hypothetical protein